MDSSDPSPRSFHPGTIVGGLILLGLGAALLLDRTGAVIVFMGLITVIRGWR